MFWGFLNTSLQGIHFNPVQDVSFFGSKDQNPPPHLSKIGCVGTTDIKLKRRYLDVRKFEEF